MALPPSSFVIIKSLIFSWATSRAELSMVSLYCLGTTHSSTHSSFCITIVMIPITFVLTKQMNTFPQLL